MILNFTVGDWSNDGHGRTETFPVQVNTSDPNQVSAAIHAGAELCGLTRPTRYYLQACEEYEDNSFPSEDLLALIEYGFVPDTDEIDITLAYGPDDLLEEGTEVYPSPKAWASIHVFLANLGDPTLNATLLPPTPTLTIGGYGLFS
jgi:hypothetical protein